MTENWETILERSKKERQQRAVRIAYLDALQTAKRYYSVCQETGRIPLGGLQKALYDLGSRVRINSKKKERDFLLYQEWQRRNCGMQKP